MSLTEMDIVNLRPQLVAFIAAANPAMILELIERVRRAEARIAELEEALTEECRQLARTTVHTAAAMGTMRLTMGEEMVKFGYGGLREKLSSAEARIAETAKLHRKYAYYELEDYCLDTTDEHREEHHHESSDDIGEFYCDQMPTGDVCCETCRDVNGDRVDWPCPTAVSLGLNEGDER